MKSVKVVAVVSAVLLIFLAAASCSTISKEKQASQGKNVNLIFKGQDESGANVTITLPAISYVPEKVFPITRKQASWATPEDAMKSVFSAFKADDVDWVIKNFPPDEQQKVKDMDNDKEIRDRNKQFFDKYDYYSLKYDVEYKNYHILIIKFPGEKNFDAYDFKQTPNGWKQTNELSYDGTEHTILQAAMEGQITETGKDVNIVAEANGKTFAERYDPVMTLPIPEATFLRKLDQLGIRYEVQGDRRTNTVIEEPRHLPTSTFDLSKIQRRYRIYGNIDRVRNIGEAYVAYVDTAGFVVYIENDFAYTGT